MATEEHTGRERFKDIYELMKRRGLRVWYAEVGKYEVYRSTYSEVLKYPYFALEK